MPYDFRDAEKHWSLRWAEDRAWAAPRVPAREKRYVLEMFPYPSGDMHMGHVENYTIGDAIARYWRMRGHDVLHPMGFDALGLPAENAAIDRGRRPREWTYENIAAFTESCRRLGFFYDWERSFNTCDPEYYRWNQWLFLKLYERGLAYRKAAKVNWCPSCRTVLANEQLSSGVCWRCGSEPEVRDLEQWFFRTTEYAQRLLDDMDALDWGTAVLTQQRNWIGRSEGVVVRFTIAETGDEVPIFTTRPDTLYGVTFFVFAPEHPIAGALADRAGLSADYEAFVADVRRATEIERLAAGAERRAFDLRAYAVNPLNGERVPVFASDYVLMEYGTGAIMAVPGHDQRDWEFARQIGVPVREVISGGDVDSAAWDGEGEMVSSGPFTGTPSSEGKRLVTEHLEREGIGREAVQYRLRDWLISRQRYWGTPIPIVYCDACGTVPVPESDLPVVLPDVVDFQPTGGAMAPLATASGWVDVACPRCGARARRETDTMDTFVDSSWYFLRFCDPHDASAPFDPALVNPWMPVDQYTGGIEHAVMHLIYARFVTKFLHDLGMVAAVEPFSRLMNHGMIKMGGKAMSKSLGNVVDPSEVLELFGADALRVYILFIGPPDMDFDWPAEGAQAVRGAWRFVDRVWRLVDDNVERLAGAGPASGGSDLRRTVHRLLASITADYERFAFNTAIAKLMELVTGLATAGRDGGSADTDLREGVEVVLRCLAPVAPYVTEECWSRLGLTESVHTAAWPDADEALSRVERATLVVQVDSKVRDRIDVAADIGEAEAVAAALASERVREWLGGREPARVVARPPRLVNLLTS